MRKEAKGWLWIVAVFPAVLLAEGRYETWSLGIPQDHRGFASDPDLDLRPNGLEFVLGALPLEPDFAPDPELGEVSEGPDRFATLTFVTAAAVFEDVALSVEACGDSLSWTPVASLLPSSTWTGSGRVTTEAIAGGSRVRVIVRDAVPFAPEQARFLRLFVSLRADRDADGMSDGYEEANGLDPDANDASLDLDGDGLTNFQEFTLSTRANGRDSDGDGFLDGFEVASGTAPATPEGTPPSGHPHPATQLVIYLPSR